MKAECPNCGWSKEVPEKASGRKGKCPKCEEFFLIGETSDEEAKAQQGSSTSKKGQEPEKDEATCPYCAESIKKGAKKCRFCGEWLDESEPSPEAVETETMPAPREGPPPVRPERVSAKAGHDANAPTVNVNVPKRSSSWGIVGLIMGVVSLVLSFVPFIGVLSIPLAALAVLLAGIGFVIALGRSGVGIGWPIGGGAVAILALVMGISQVIVIGGVASGIDEAATQMSKEHERLQTEWDAPQGFNKNEIDFRVTNTAVEHVPLEGPMEAGKSEDEIFVVWLAVSNNSENRRLKVSDLQRDYVFGDQTSLEDASGNTYSSVTFGMYEPEYDHGAFKVDPGKEGRVALFFEKPLDQAKRFTLSLPAGRFNGSGTVLLKWDAK